MHQREDADLRDRVRSSCVPAGLCRGTHVSRHFRVTSPASDLAFALYALGALVVLGAWLWQCAGGW
jgi:hypothetical protein